MQGPTFLVLEVHPSHYSKQIIKAILQLSPTNLFLSTVTHYTVRIVTFAVYYISHTIFQIKHIRCVSKLPLWLFWASLSVHDCVWWSMPVAGMKLVHINSLQSDSIHIEHWAPVWVSLMAKKVVAYRVRLSFDHGVVLSAASIYTWI